MLVVIIWSAFRVRRNILPEGVCTANFAGFSRVTDCCLLPELIEPELEEGRPGIDVVDALEIVIEDTMLSELDGRANGLGETRPLASFWFDDTEGSVDGCWRTANTKVLFIASLEHCGWMT